MNFLQCSTVVLACLCAFTVGSVLQRKPFDSSQIAAGFEFVGIADGKVFLTQINPRYVDWFTAKSICHQAGYEMGLVESAAQDEVVRLFYRSNGGAGFAWLDATDFITRGEWHSTTTGGNLTFFNWQADRPTKYPDWNCMMWKQINIQGPGSFWDVPCTDTNYAFCQLQA